MKKLKRKQKNKKKIVVLIPARGGSKSIKSKNLYLIDTKPLVAWSIEFAKKDKLVDRVFVSTDSKNISFYAKYYGAEIHKREKKYSKDNSLIFSTINSFLKYLITKLKYKPDILVILEPTSPFREKKLISKCVNKMVKTKSDSIATFVFAKTHPARTWYLKKNGKPISLYKSDAWKPRQRLKPVYELDGSLYAFKIKTNFKLSKGLLFGKSTSYILSNKNQIEIDNQKDIKFANIIIENRHKKK